MPLAFDEAFFEDFFVGEPEIGDVRGTEAENVFQRAADFPEMKIHADALEQFDERLGAHGFDRLGTGAVVVQPVVGGDINGLRADSMAINVKETPGFGLGRGKPCCYTSSRWCTQRLFEGSFPKNSA